MSNLIDILKKEHRTLDDIVNANLLTPKDFRKIAQDYQEILALEEKYKQSTFGKQEIAIEIRNKSEDLLRILAHIQVELRIHAQTYNYLGYTLTDTEKAIRLILRQANKNAVQYGIIKLSIEGETNFETRYDDRTKLGIVGDVWLVMDKETIKLIDPILPYHPTKIGRLTEELLREEKSFLVYTNYYYDRIVKPNCQFSRITEEKITANDITNGISCYLFDDDLGNSVKNFMNFIKINGADIKDASEDELEQKLNEMAEQRVSIKK